MNHHKSSGMSYNRISLFIAEPWNTVTLMDFRAHQKIVLAGYE